MEFRYDGSLNAWHSELHRDGAQVLFGKFNATLPGYGHPVTPARTWIMRGNADDGGKVLAGTGAAYLFSIRRLLLTAAQTGNNSFFGGCDRLSVNADVSAVTGVMAAHWGMLEVKASGILGASGGCGAVRGDININTGGDIGTGKIASCFLAACESLGASHTGSAAVVHVPNPATGTFDFFAVFGAAPGGIAAKATALSGLTSTHRLIVKCPDGNTGYIPIIETWS